MNAPEEQAEPPEKKPAGQPSEGAPDPQPELKPGYVPLPELKPERVPKPEPKARKLFRPASRPRAGRWRSLPFIVMGLLLLGVLGARVVLDFLAEAARERGGRRAAIDWLPLGAGKVEFLDTVKTFRVAHRIREDGYRIEEEGGVAFEARDLDELVRVFVRTKLSGVQPGEAIRIVFERQGGRPPGPAGRGRPSVDWVFVLRAEKRGQEAWFRLEGTELVARSTEDLKEKAAREAAREVMGFFHGFEG